MLEGVKSSKMKELTMQYAFLKRTLERFATKSLRNGSPFQQLHAFRQRIRTLLQCLYSERQKQ